MNVAVVSVLLVCAKVYLLWLSVCLWSGLDEEISNMRRELDKYGIQMPAFSKIGGMLASEVRTTSTDAHLYCAPTDFQNYFTGRLAGQFAIKLSLKIPPHPKHVAALPCDILVFENCTDRSTATAN